MGAITELVKLCALYGPVEEYRIQDDYPADEFTEVIWIKFKKIQNARYYSHINQIMLESFS